MSTVNSFEPKTAGYFGQNRTSAHYSGSSVQIPLTEIYNKSTSAEAIQRRKQIQEYDYVTRPALFKFILMNTELSSDHKEYVLTSTQSYMS